MIVDNTKKSFLADFPVTIEVPVAWGEMDAFGHVNNIVYFRYFESAHIAYFEKIDFIKFKENIGVGPILSKTSCRFKKAISYPDTVLIGARATDIEEDRFVIHYRVVSKKNNSVAAEGEGMFVCFDYRKNKKTSLPATLVENIKRIENINF